MDSLYAAAKAAVAVAHTWDAQLPFTLTSAVDVRLSAPDVKGLPLTTQDLFDVGSAPCFKAFKFYFHPTEFAFDGNFKTSVATWSDLRQRLFRAAAQNGFHLFSNGGKGSDCLRIFLCSRGGLMNVSSSKRAAPGEHRVSYLRSDRRSGARPEGRDLPRRRNTEKPICTGKLCPVKLQLGVDSSGFFVFGGRGTKQHAFHPKLLTKVVPLLKREMAASEIAHVGDYRKAGLSCAGSAQVLRLTSNILIPRTTIRYLSHTIEYAEYSQGIFPVQKTTTDKLFDSLKAERHDHVVLSHKGTAHPNPGVQVSDFVASSGGPDEDFASTLPENERVQMNDFCTKHRISRKVPDDKDLFLAVIWMTLADRCIFRKFPYVVKIDITFKTNSRGIPFLSITGKTSDNEIFTILRCFVPNEQAWIFRWLLLHALPKILGKDMNRIQMIISDGDSQEIAQINNLIQLVMMQAIRQRCAWHIVDRSWDRYVYKVPKAGSTRKTYNTYYETTRKIIFAWLYSMMTKGCETKEEYQVSKVLFVFYLESPELRKKLGPQLVKSVQDMYKTAIYPHEGDFVFYRRRTLFAFEEYTNSTQEASFAAVKRGTLAVLPSMDVDTSLKQLNQQALRKTIGYEATGLSRLSNYTLWSTISETTSKMVPYGGGLLEAEYTRSHDFRSTLFVRSEFRVAYDGQNEEWDNVYNSPFISSFMPCFKRIRVVKLIPVEALFFLVCDCGHFERSGIPCRHLWHVKCKYWPGSEPKITDIHPMWHSLHKAYAFSVDENGNKLAPSAALERMAIAFPDLVPGLCVPTATPANDESLLQPLPEFSILSAAERCVNWPTDVINDLLHDSAGSGLPGMSQEVCMYTQQSDDSDDGMMDFETRFKMDTAEVQKKREEQGSVAAALIPLTKELLISVEKAPYALQETCVSLRNMIAALNVEDDHKGNEETGSDSMFLPMSKTNKKRKPKEGCS
jgi:hypothetical protein